MFVTPRFIIITQIKTAPHLLDSWVFPQIQLPIFPRPVLGLNFPIFNLNRHHCWAWKGWIESMSNKCHRSEVAVTNPGHGAAKIGANSAKAFLTNTTEHRFTSTVVGPPRMSSKT